jgi:hypothetical protein
VDDKASAHGFDPMAKAGEAESAAGMHATSAVVGDLHNQLLVLVPQLVQLLHREASTVLHGTYSEKTG